MVRPRPYPAFAVLVAADGEGCTEALLTNVHGVTPLLLELVRAGRASASTIRRQAGREVLDLPVVKITDAGRQALADERKAPDEYMRSLKPIRA